MDSLFNKNIKINTPKGLRIIGLNHPAFFVAEVSANHEQEYEKALSIIHASAEAGADAIKLQTYTPDSMTIDCDNDHFLVRSENSKNWNKKLFDLYKTAYTPREWHKPLKKITENLGMVFFSTPFDSNGVDFLTELNVEMFKVASYELTDIPLLKKIAQTGKPVILSVGFGTLNEITEAINTLRKNGTKDIVILHCVTNYSKKPDIKNTNLLTMIDIGNRFNVIYGFSDNTGGIEIPFQAVMMGASIIEKHIVVNKNDKGLDSHFSISGEELSDLILNVRRAEKIKGKAVYGPQNKNETYFKKFRRSIFVTKDIKKGENLSYENVRVIRPEAGLPPKFFDKVIGKKAAVDIKRGTPLDWGLLK